MSDDKNKPPSLPYYIPGANGIALDAALRELAQGPQPGVLIVRKFKVGDRFAFSVKMTTGDDPPDR